MSKDVFYIILTCTIIFPQNGSLRSTTKEFYTTSNVGPFLVPSSFYIRGKIAPCHSRVRTK